MNKRQTIAKFKKILVGLDIPSDIFNWDALDFSLNYAENFKLFLELVAPLISQHKVLEFQELKELSVRAYDSKALSLELAESRRIESEALKTVQEGGDAEAKQVLNQLLGSARTLTRLLTDSTEFHGLILYGSAGLGKSFSVISALNEASKLPEQDYVVFTGHLTNLAVFRALYRNRDKIVFFDDISANSIKDKLFLAILKAASYSVSGERIVQWNSTSKILEKEGIPQSFAFKGKLIIAANSVPEQDADFRALASRCLIREVSVSFREVQRLFYALARNPFKQLTEPERKEAVDYLFDSLRASEATDNLQLRLLMQLLELRAIRPESWRDDAKLLIRENPVKRALLDAIASSVVRGEQAQSFYLSTGLSRATFFRMLRSIKVS